MNTEYVTGAVINLYENDDKSYCILNSVEIDSYKYLLLQPLDENGEIKKFELEKVFVIKLDKEEKDFELVKDADSIEKVIIKTMADGLFNV